MVTIILIYTGNCTTIVKFVDTTAPVVQCTPQTIVLDATCRGRNYIWRVSYLIGQIPTIAYSVIDCDVNLTTAQFPNNLTIISGITTINVTVNVTDSAGNTGNFLKLK